ncbi:MAG: TlpA family protein disulfide reductase [Bacillota bacterium]|jgi:thiol-disulfide isomerase/thioredoxin
MRKLAVLLVMAVLLAGCVGHTAPDPNPDPSPNSNPEPGDQGTIPAPAFSLQDLGGNTWSLAELKGNVVILYFWTAGCPNCIRSLPDLSALQEELPEDVRLLLLNGGDSKKKVEEVMEAYPNLTVLMNATAIFGVYGVRYVPTTVFIDAEGRLDRGYIGPIPNQGILQIIEELR